MPSSQDQRERMEPRSSTGMDGFPQAGMMCESLGKAVVHFYYRIVQNLFPSALTAEFQRHFLLLSDRS